MNKNNENRSIRAIFLVIKNKNEKIYKKPLDKCIFMQ